MSEAEPTASLCFVDTNVWLYAFISGPDAAKSNLARQLLRDSEEAVVGATILYSEDLQAGLAVDGRLTVRNPFAS
jgi:predicted nucleic acid-binding protein